MTAKAVISWTKLILLAAVFLQLEMIDLKAVSTTLDLHLPKLKKAKASQVKDISPVLSLNNRLLLCDYTRDTF